MKIPKIFTQNYCILHSWQGLPEYLPSDLDIVVSPMDLPKLEARLLNFPGARLVNLLQHESTCYFFVLAFQEKEQLRFLQVDAAVDYRRNGLVWFRAEELLDGRRRWKDFWVASPEVEFKYLLVKKILKGAVPERSAARLKELVEELGEQARELAAGLLGYYDGEKVVRWIQRGDWDTFQNHIRELQKTLKRQKLRQDPFNPFRYWLPEIKRIWRRWRHPTGLFVVVLGPDGAGKSTLIDRLEADLSGAFRRTARIHLMPGLFRKKGNGSPVTNPHAKPPRSFLVSLLKLVYYFFDYTLGYWLKVRPALVKSTLVLFDRYYDDLLIDPLRYRYGGPMWLARWLSRLIPRPDLWLILDVPEDELLRRKQEVPFEELHRQREAYRRLASELSNAVILDGSLPPEEVARQAEDAILEYMHERYLSRRRLWFSESRVEGEGRYFSEALGAHISQKGKPFFHLALPDGRGYLIPLNSRKAAVAGLSLYSPQKPSRRVLKGLLKVGLRSGIARHLLPRINLDLRELEEHLAQVFSERNLSMAISLGTPGPHRKPVVQVMTREGKVLGYVKVGWNKETRRLVENEAWALNAVANLRVPGLKVPEILAVKRYDQRIYLITAPLYDHKSVERQPLHLDVILDVLAALADAEKHQSVWVESSFGKHLASRLGCLRNSLPDYDYHMLARAVELLKSRLENAILPWTWRLGDVSPYNLAIDFGTRMLLVTDLEYACKESLPGWDLFHFLRSSYGPIYNWKTNDSINGMVSKFFMQLGLKAVLPNLLYLAYLVDLGLLWYESWGSKKPNTTSAIKGFKILRKEIAILLVELSRVLE